MQSGVQGTKSWRLDWDTLEKDNRWTNPLMGWASSGDFMQGTKLSFATQDDAIRFAEKNGWDYFVQAPHKQEFHPKSYSSNFTRTQMNPAKIGMHALRAISRESDTDHGCSSHQVIACTVQAPIPKVVAYAFEIHE